MSDTPVNSLMKDVLLHQYNPAGIQRAILQKLTDVTEGKVEIVDPINPFVFALEAASVLTAAFMEKNSANTRKQYPYSAQTYSDLYVHMSDKDYINRFATPSKTKISFLIPLDELENRLVLDPVTGNKKIVIPRNTYITVAGADFSIQYPVVIKKLSHGGLQITYDTDIESPLHLLETNFVNHEIRTLGNNINLLYFELDVQQFNVVSNISSLSSATDFRIDIGLTDKYYYTRVYVENASNKWVEIKTTHTDQIYDPIEPTAVLKVTDTSVNVSIPQIYTGTGLFSRNIRIDIYQTKGPLDILLSEYQPTAFGVTWLNIDKSEDTVYVAATRAIKDLLVLSTYTVTGGSNPLSFEALRLQVIKNAIGSSSLPITNVQIENALENSGYQIVKNIDNVTNRVFLATRALPTPVNTNLITPAAGTMGTLSISMNTAALNSTVKDNGTSVTITPDTLFKSEGGIYSIVNDQERNNILSLDPTGRSVYVNNAKYLYTPFHYVLDSSLSEFSTRVYHLDTPTVITKLFGNENDTTGIQVGTKNHFIEKVATGYKLTISLQSSDEFKAIDDDEVFVQLAYIPSGEIDRAYLNGVFLGLDEFDERIYSFDLSTNFDVRKNDTIGLNGFALYDNIARLSYAELITEFDVIFSTVATMPTGWLSSKTDLLLGRQLLPNGISGLSNEVFRLKFGDTLDKLWSRTRSVASEFKYLKHLVDVPAIYEKDVYQLDANGSSITIVNGEPVTTILHHAGDPVLNGLGGQVLQYQRGDIILDANGDPIKVSERTLTRQIDFLLIEGAYWFANDASSIKYRKDMVKTLIDWITNDLSTISNSLLEQTKLYFYPKINTGTISVLTGDGLTRNIEASQNLRIDIYLNSLNYANTELRNRLTDRTIYGVNKAFEGSLISLDDIAASLRGLYGTDVISVDVTGLANDPKLHTFRILDDSSKCSIRKRLTPLPNGSLIVEEDLAINFIKYDK